MKSQCRALSMTAVLTWDVTLNKARQVYSSIVRSAITYAAATWHTLRDLRNNKRSHVKILKTIQNKCLRRVVEIYKVINKRVVEAKTEILSLQITINQVILRNQVLKDNHLVTKLENARIQRKLREKRDKRRIVLQTSTEDKEEWALRTLRLENWNSL